MTCKKCGRAIPAQLTVPPNAKPHVRPAGKAGAGNDDRLSFADTAMSRIGKSGMPGVGLGVVGLSAFALLAGIFWVLHSSQTGPPPPIVESATPAAQMTQMLVSYQAPDYVIGFTLMGADGKEMARSGRVKLTISAVTHLGVQGGGSFDKESKLYESTFEVNPTHFSWYTTGGLGFRARRLLCGIRVPAKLLSRQPPDHAEGKVTAKFFDGQDQTKMIGFYTKFFFPSLSQKKPATAETNAPAATSPK